MLFGCRRSDFGGSRNPVLSTYVVPTLDHDSNDVCHMSIPRRPVESLLRILTRQRDNFDYNENCTKKYSYTNQKWPAFGDALRYISTSSTSI
jgi:hypothetical protein